MEAIAIAFVSVSAKEKSSGSEASVTVKPSYGLADADIERMLRDSFEHAKEDVHARALAENRVEGQRLIEATLSAIPSISPSLSGPAPSDARNAGSTQYAISLAVSFSRLAHPNNLTFRGNGRAGSDSSLRFRSDIASHCNGKRAPHVKREVRKPTRRVFSD